MWIGGKKVLVATAVLISIPPYAYVVCKFAAAGWLSGVSLFIRTKRARRLAEEEVRNEQDEGTSR